MRRLLFLASLLAACSSKGDDPAQPTDAGGDASGCTCTFDCTPEDDQPAPPPHTPRWAFRPWISKDISDRADTYAFVKGFEDRDIPVGAVVLDSPWETNYNTLIPNPKRYGDFPSLVSDLHAKNIKVVLWITQMVNFQSFDFEMGGDLYPGEAPNYEEGLACGFYVDDGQSYGWWKGLGGAIDFFNPKARRWWHAQQDVVLDAGLDGWKLDFGDSYVTSDPVKTAQGALPHQQYSEKYYQDYLTYGRKKRGKDFLTDVRPWDKSYDFEGRFFARREHAPVAWVGDNRRDWVGLEDALDEILRSAKAKYVVLGSDIGGYLDKDDKDLTINVPADTLVFARWTAVSGLTPFFQLHGRANLTPWTVQDHVDETVALYRYWAKLHDAMVPFWYSLAEEAWKSGGAILAPVNDTWTGDFRFTVGDAFLVAPIVDASGKRDVPLPSGARWFDWWTGEVHDGGTTVTVDVSADRMKIPLFVREGAIVPLDVVDDANGLGTKASKGARTIAIWPAADSTFPLHDEDDAVTTIGAKAASGGATITLSRATTPVILRVRLDAAKTATLNGSALTAVTTRDAFDAATSALYVDGASKLAWVKLPAGASAQTITIAP